jgi:hypothetical protein
MAEDERLTNEELARVTQEHWAFCVRHTEKLQEVDFAKYRTGRNFTALVINLQDSETENKESDEDDSDVTGAGGRYDDDNDGDDDDFPSAVPLD